LLITVGDNVNVTSLLVVERGYLGWWNSSRVHGWRNCSLRSVPREDVLWFVKILAELEVVYLGGGSPITVSSDD
jgi:hypothetical protein